ncbi:MAG: SDR family oxidoreductase [Acidobacteria bacterium]|jgi:NAD(P)-dependent dehydrogenase (short-subunit alcohol dehydrogenase family)|nr:SDR family oxidoreductase [Acidobacteriota bacterium]
MGEVDAFSAFDLGGKYALITGGASGLGAATADLMTNRGARVAIADINMDAATDLARRLDGIAVQCDVTDSAQVRAAVETTVAKLGALDVMVNNAGIAPPPDNDRFQKMVNNQMSRLDPSITAEPLDILVNLSDAVWDRMIRTHLYGVFYGTREALAHMTPRRTGSIINISSILGMRPSASAPHYSVAKAGIIALTKATSAEVSQFGVRINAVCPGYTDTPLLGHYSEMMRSVIVSQIGMGRMGVSDEIAQVIAFLASPAASYCTGEVFSASGGYLA